MQKKVSENVMHEEEKRHFRRPSWGMAFRSSIWLAGGAVGKQIERKERKNVEPML